MKNSLVIGIFAVFSFYLTVILGLQLLPLQNSPTYAVTAVHLPPGQQDSILTHFAAWDSAFYVRLSLLGYRSGDDTAAFYPLWPLILRVVSSLTGGVNLIIVGLVLASSFFLAAIPMMLRLCVLTPSSDGTSSGATDNTNVRFLLLYVCYPGTLFFSVPYTESLFLILSAGLLFALTSERIGLATLLAFLVPLSRPVGCFLLLPVCYWVLAVAKSKWRMIVPISLLIGYASYFCLMYLTTGSPIAGFEAQRMFPASGSVVRLFEPGRFIETFLAIDALHSIKGSLIDRAMLLFAAYFTFSLYKRNRLLFWFALPLVIVPAVTNGLASYVRYLAVVFPVFWQAAVEINSVGGRFLFYGTCLLFALVKCMLILRHTNYFWAG